MKPQRSNFGGRNKTQPQSSSGSRPRIACLRNALLLLFTLVTVLSSIAPAQSSLPFEVSNPRNKKWSAEEAARIYSSACDLLARTVRPEKPPRLHPRFRLVLGAEADEFVRVGPDVEIRLKSWNSTKFAQAVVMVAARDLLQADDMVRIVHQSVSLAHATVSVGNLRENR